ncbi:hypothetical protein TWF102_002647 [Orbilia oligospora]|uniref:CHAT domain-containing protein n=1 Tax=Orbilia oligospora TaxID=2813651 RepID=A0A7C8NHF2_ORBOL|nr:hypothetical protein TWF102_002647 [Orbilia oligospora]KAF3116201.1 hypothetical protein TWF103_009426 [Orbilia oligospora]
MSLAQHLSGKELHVSAQTSRIRDLEHELEEYQAETVKATWKIKDIEYKLQKLKELEIKEAKNWEAQIGREGEGLLCRPPESTDSLSPVVEEVSEAHREAHFDEAKVLIPTITNVDALGETRTFNALGEASEISASINISQSGSTEKKTGVAKEMAQGIEGPGIDCSLEYYRDLHFPDDAIEMSFLDMGLEQLYEVASDVEAALELDVEADLKTDAQCDQLNLLGNIHYFIFARTGAVDDIENAIKNSERAVDDTNTDGPKYAPRLRNLITMLMKKYECTNSLADLDQAVLRAETMATLRRPDWQAQFLDLVKMKGRKCLRTGSKEEMEELMVMYEMMGQPNLVRLSTHDTEEKVRTLSRFIRNMDESGGSHNLDIDNLDMAVKLCEELTASIYDPPKKLAILSVLSQLLLVRYRQSYDFDDINKAIKIGEEALAIMPDDQDYLGKAKSLRYLATCFGARFERADNLEDLNMAIGLGEKAVIAACKSGPEQEEEEEKEEEEALQFLAVAFVEKSRRTENVDYLQKATESYQKALKILKILPRDDAKILKVLSNLASCYSETFHRTRNLDDLHAAIQANTEALELTPHNSPERASLLGNAAVCFHPKFDESGDLQDLHIAVKKSKEALKLAAPDNPDRIKMMVNLSSQLGRRFEITGNLDDLQLSIKASQEAVSIMPADREGFDGRCFGNLATALDGRFQRTGNFDDLNSAIGAIEEVIKMTSNDIVHKAGFLLNLGGYLLHKFIKTRDIADINKSVETMNQALEMTPQHARDRPVVLSRLGNAYALRFSKTKNLDDLHLAIRRGEEALAEIPHNHPYRAEILLRLAVSLMNKFKHSNSIHDLEKLLTLSREASGFLHAPLPTRMRAAKCAFLVQTRNEMWIEAACTAELSIKLLPLIAPRQLKQRDQQHMLEKFAGLASDGAATILKAGKDVHRALKLLELGRGVITGLRFGARTDLSELRLQYPELAGRFEQLRSVLDSGTAAGALVSLEEIDVNYNANIEFEEIIDSIRSLPNFENFLLPPGVDELMGAACQGPIVIINVSSFRCDAFLIESSVIRSLHLPNLRKKDIERNVEFMKSMRSIHALPHDVIRQLSRMLEWLWDAAVNPVLNELKFSAPPLNDNWPRVWWIPTGQLSLLPLHAAGYHAQEAINGSGPTPGKYNTTLDRVVSSYSSSIKALLYSRQNSQNSELGLDEALLVSMDETPGHPDLEYAAEEVSALANLLPSQITTVKLKRPSKQTILNSLKSCSIFHFAGHGESNPSDPSKSSLLASDWQENPLTVDDLIESDFRQQSPLLAYLSACSTSNNSAEKLQDEAIHLVTACQLAGFKHVVGSLWEVSDKYCVVAAEEIYKTIIEDGVINGDKIALGVHKATRRLREITRGRGEDSLTNPPLTEGLSNEESSARGPRSARPAGYQSRIDTNSELGNPLIWAAYIHVGP